MPEGMPPSGSPGLRQEAPGVVSLTGLEMLPAGQGGVDLLTRLVEEAFADGHHRVEAYLPTGEGHLPRRRVLQRVGLRPEGTARGRGGEVDGIPQDVLLLARVRTDPAPGEPAAFIGMLNATLPRKRVIVQGLVGDGQGQILLCELTYKRDWDLPGGVADPAESPVASLERELSEELGLDLPVGDLVAVDWLPPYKQWEDAVLLVFDVGVHPQLVERAELQRTELVDVHWVRPEDAHRHVAPYVARLLGSLGRATERPDTHLLFLEDGLPRERGTPRGHGTPRGDDLPRERGTPHEDGTSPPL